MSIFFKYLQIILLLFSGTIIAQSYSVSGRVVDAKNSPISYANIILLSKQDSTVVSGASSEDNGSFKFKSITSGEYILKTSFIGYRTVFQNLNINSHITIGAIVLEDDLEALETINIAYKKPTVERKADRLVFKVAETALTEGSILDVLKTTPAVIINGESITIKREQATVYINDRKVNLSGPELAQLLESTPANSISEIEVITNPSAQYDANDGKVLRIKMSKNVILGYRGRAFANYKQARKPTYTVGLSNFFKNKTLDFYANYTFSAIQENRKDNRSVDYIQPNGILNETWLTTQNRLKKLNTHTVNLNLDIGLDSTSTLSAGANMLFSPNIDYRINNNTNTFDASNNFNYDFDAMSASNRDKYNFGFDVDYSKAFKNESTLKVNAHYTIFDYDANQNIFSIYNTPTPFETSFLTEKEQHADLFSAQADYFTSLSENIEFTAGLKTSLIDNKSSIKLFDTMQTPALLDITNSNSFKYEENIVAGYANMDASWDKFQMVLGLRLEQTDTKGRSFTHNQTITRDYLEWFPNASLNYNISDNYSIYANYNRSITRPTFSSLNPFKFFLNDNNVVEGNPFLKPTILQKIDLGVSIHDNINVMVYYIAKDDAITELSLQDPVTQLVMQTQSNIDRLDEYGIDIEASFEISPKWSIYTYLSEFHQHYKTIVNNQNVEKSIWLPYIEVSNYFSFLKDNSLKASLNLNYVGREIDNLTDIEPRFFSSLTVTKSILKQKGMLSLTLSDLFNKEDYDTKTQFLNQNNRVFFNEDNRFIRFGFSYKFGNTTLKTNERNKSRKERDRLKGTH